MDTKKKSLYGGVLPSRILPDGTEDLWDGDESNGRRRSESNLSSLLLKSLGPPPKERSYWEIYGGGRPNPEVE